MHDEQIKDSHKEKYLGDYITRDGNSNETIVKRKTRGYAVLAEIKAILNDIPLGKRRMEIGLALRESWFINGCLFNSEIWGSYSNKVIQDIEVIDHTILRFVLGAQSKVPVEQLYLETGCLPIPHVISVRRMCYLKTILDRHIDEITSKVYHAMKAKPYKGDWFNLLMSDFKKVGVTFDEESIREMDSNVYRKEVKTNVWIAAHKELLERKSIHKKVRDIIYDGVRAPQKYLTSSMFNNNMCSLLFNLRCRSENNFKDNFHTLYGQTPLCILCGKFADTQEHALTCEYILNELKDSDLYMLSSIKYEHLFGTLEEQYNITMLYQEIINIRDRFTEDRTRQAYLGNNYTGPH